MNSQAYYTVACRVKCDGCVEFEMMLPICEGWRSPFERPGRVMSIIINSDALTSGELTYRSIITPACSLGIEVTLISDYCSKQGIGLHADLKVYWVMLFVQLASLRTPRLPFQHEMRTF